MMSGDNTLRVIGVEHIATKNNATVRVRIYLQGVDGKLFSFDADIVVWELDRIHTTDITPLQLGIRNDGVAL